jgi:hypothetical protein
MRKGLLKTGGFILAAAGVLAVAAGHRTDAARRADAAPLSQPNDQRIFAFASSFDKGRQLLYFFDGGTQRICVYLVNHDGKSTELELVAVRNYGADLQLSEFNTAPSVADIEEMLGQAPRHH